MNKQDAAQGFKYFAFISYSRKDEKWAKWLHAKLEGYKLPTIANAGLPKDLPKEIKPIFLDKTDIGTGQLQQNLSQELEDSKFLIVICSPNAADSFWVNKEVNHFKNLGREKYIIPFILEGTPNPGEKSKKQCYPPALDPNILGASLTELTREQAFIKIVASLLELKYDTLWQRHERRRKQKRNIRYSSIIAVTVILCLGIYYLWDYNKVKIKYYKEYVDRWGIPVGLFELNAEQAAKNAMHYQFSYSRNKLRTVVRVNAHGTPIPNENEYPDQRPIKMEIKYSEAGILERVDWLDQFDKVTVSCKYSGKQFDEIDFKDDKGKDVAALTSTGIGIAGFNSNVKTKINRHTVFRNNEGEIIRVIFKYGGFDNVSDANGIFGNEYELDSLGRIITQRYLDEHGKMKENGLGVAGTIIEYDEQGNIFTGTCFSGKMEYANNEKGFAHFKRSYDANGNLVEESYYGEDGKLALTKVGCSKVKQTYNKNTDVALKSYSGLNNEPVVDTNGVAKYSFTYNEDGLASETVNYDINDRLCYDRNRVCVYKYKYDHLVLTEEAYFDTQRRPCYSKMKCAKIIHKKNNTLSESSFYDVSGNLCINADGFALVDMLLDKKSMVTEIRYLGITKQPCYNSSGYSSAKVDYDDRGNLIAASVYDVNGNKCSAEKSFSSYTSRYDESGRMVECFTFGADGKPCYNSGLASSILEYAANSVTLSNKNADGTLSRDDAWTAKTITNYNYLGKPEMVYCYDENNNLAINKNGFAIKKNEYDRRGNIIRISIYDANGYPCTKNSVFENEYDYDAYGRQIEIRQYGISNNLINQSEGDGIAVKTFSYDRRGNLIKESYFNNYGLAMEINGYSTIETSYNDKDENIEDRYKDKVGNLALSNYEYAIVKNKHDVYGNVVEEFLFGTDGKPGLAKSNVASDKITYDYRGNITSMSFYGLNNEACVNINSIHTSCSAYDDFGNRIVDSSLDIYGKPCSDKWGLFQRRRAYDDRGNITSDLYIRVDSSNNGLAPLTLMKYDEKNNMVQKVFANSNGSVCTHSNGGCPIVISTYDNRNLCIENSFYHDFDKPCHNYFKIRMQYDERGKEKGRSFVD